MDVSRRDILKAASIWLVDQLACSRRFAFAGAPSNAAGRDDRKVIIVACGGVRRAETFLKTGLQNIPHLYNDLLPQCVFYPLLRNAGVTSHYNTISSILTGNWQRLDDWGMTPPANPTFFEYLRKRMELSQDNAWLISSNKALTSRIGASSIRDFGPRYGANVIFPKQLLINTVSPRMPALCLSKRKSSSLEIRGPLKTSRKRSVKDSGTRQSAVCDIKRSQRKK